MGLRTVREGRNMLEKNKIPWFPFPERAVEVFMKMANYRETLELLQETRVMLVQGTGFNWPAPDHFRIVFLPHEDDLREAIGRVARFLALYRKRHGT